MDDLSLPGSFARPIALKELYDIGSPTNSAENPNRDRQENPSYDGEARPVSALTMLTLHDKNLHAGL